MENTLKIGIVGAGAVGCYVGARLATSGASVVFFGRDRFANEIRKHGLCAVDMNERRFEVSSQSIVFGTHPDVLSDCDVLICCVKSTHTSEVARQVRSVVREGASIVSLQNGVSNADTLRTELAHAVARGIVAFNVRPMGRGTFQQATSGQIVLEKVADSRIGELTALLKRAGLDARLSTDIRAVQWSKLMTNLNNAVSALSDVPTRDLLASRDYRRVIADLIEEAIDILDRAGLHLARLGPVPVKWFPFMLRLPTPLFSALARAQLKVDPQARSSMWEDLSRGRPTEIDELNGAIVRLAKEHEIDAPLNRRIVALVREAETKGQGSPKMSATLLRRALEEP